MNALLRKDADQIIKESIAAVLPDEAVRRTLKDYKPGKGRTLLVATGKAAWQMAKAAVETLGHVDGGVVVTKYEHVMGEIPDVACYEAGHPVPDENSFAATKKALELVEDLSAEDTVIFLLSGGGSALFELPRIPGEELQDITRQLLASGADIVEMNTIRKRLAAVRGGRFALACAPAKVLSIVLSDILGDPLDMIASGPAYPDSSTCAEAKAIAARYGLKLSADASRLLDEETPKELTNVETHINGSVRELCAAAAVSAEKLGYEALKERHISDVSELMNRCKLEIECEDKDNIPTDVRLKKVQDGETDNGLINLSFAYGRYLLVSSSRIGSLPANLQGIWNDSFSPMWDSKYTININAQMNYWPVESTGLSELHTPLFELIKKMVPNGRKAASEMYGARGWMAHHNTDIWGDCAPQDTWPAASYWQMGAAWLCLHILEHYL